MTYMTRRRPPAMGGGVDDFLYNIGLTDRPDPSDNVNQTAGGGTTTSAADFTQKGGVCKPANFPALDAVRAYQGQLNRVAQAKGFGKIATDGAIGAGTLALHRKVQSVAGGSVMGDPSSCMGIAPDVDILATQIKDVADALGMPATVPGPVTAILSPPTIVTKSGKIVAPPNAGLMASLSTIPTLEKLAIAGVAGAIGYLVLGKKRRRR